MISPDENPEITTPDSTTGSETTPDVSSAGHSMTGRFPAALMSIKNWLRSSINSADAPSLPQRIPPKMRLAQIGTAVAAVGVLGVTLGGAGSAPDQDVQLASESVSASGQAASGQAASLNQAAGGDQSDRKDKSSRGNTPGGMVTDTETEQRKSGQQKSGQQNNGSKGKDGSEQTKDRQQQDSPNRDGSTKQENPQPRGDDSDEQSSESQPPPEPAEDQLDAWINQASAVLEKEGYSDDEVNEDHIRTIILKESGGDPSAINNWDSNAVKGTPSKGLMQTIDPTFDSYALPGHENVWDPVDNIIAATRYSVDRYGSVSSVPGITGLQSGGSYEGY